MQNHEKIKIDEINKSIAVKVLKIYDYLNEDVTKEEDGAKVEKKLNFGTVSRKFGLTVEDAEVYLKSTCAYSQNQDNQDVCDMVATIHQNLERAKSRKGAGSDSRIDDAARVLSEVIAPNEIVVREEKKEVRNPIAQEKAKVIIEDEDDIETEDIDIRTVLRKEGISTKEVKTDAQPKQKIEEDKNVAETVVTKKKSYGKTIGISVIVIVLLFIGLRVMNIENKKMTQMNEPQTQSKAQFQATQAPKEESQTEQSSVTEQPEAIASTNPMGIVGEVVRTSPPPNAQVVEQNPSQIAPTPTPSIATESQISDSSVQNRIAMEKENERIKEEQRKAITIDSIEEFEKLLSINEVIITKDAITYMTQSYKQGDSIGNINVVVLHEKYLKLYDTKNGLSKLIILKKEAK